MKRSICIGAIIAGLLQGASLFAGDKPAAVPKELETQTQGAKKQFDLGDYAGAEAAYKKLLEEAPDNFYLFMNLSVTLYHENKTKEAEVVWRKAMELAPTEAVPEAPDNPHALRELGIAQFAMGKYDQAIGTLLKAIAFDPKDAVVHNSLGITYAQKGRSELAVKELEKAIELDGKYADANFNLAVVWATGTPANNENARKYYRRAVELGTERDETTEKLIQFPLAGRPGK